MSNVVPSSVWVRLYLIALLFLYVVWACVNYVAWPDTDAYLIMAKGLFTHGIFGYKLDSGQYFPNAFRMPIFPIVLGSINLVVRDDEMTYFTFSLVQLLAAPILPCAAFYFGRIISKPVAIIAYVLTLLHPNYLLMSISILTDILFAATFAFCTILLWRWTPSMSNRKATGIGALIGAACLFRPIMKFYLGPAILWFAISTNSWKHRIRYGLIAAVSFCVVISPWIVRNYGHYGALVFETNQGLNLLWSTAPYVTPKPEDTSETARLKSYIASHANSPMDLVYHRGPEYFVRNDYLVSKELSSVAKEVYVNDPLRIMQLWLNNAKMMTAGQSHFEALWNVIQARPLYKQSVKALPVEDAVFNRKAYHSVLEIKRVIYYLYLTIPLISLIALWLRYGKLAAFITINILYFTGLTAFVAGYDRYRLNLEPFYTVLFAFALVEIGKGIRRACSTRQGAKSKTY